jgi:acetyltransferase
MKAPEPAEATLDADFLVRPYPSQWQRRLQTRDGERIFVRPIRPEDEPLLRDLLQHVTSHDLRLRFFGLMKEFTHEFLVRLTELDYARAMAFLAFDEVSDDLVGVVRMHSDSRYETAEYAVLLRSDHKGTGLGWTLMQLIIEYTRSEGLKAIWGYVLAENSAMLAMCRELGFEVKPAPDESDTCLVKLML